VHAPSLIRLSEMWKTDRLKRHDEDPAILFANFMANLFV